MPRVLVYPKLSEQALPCFPFTTTAIPIVLPPFDVFGGWSRSPLLVAENDPLFSGFVIIEEES